MTKETHEQLIGLLREILKWIKFSGIQEARTVLSNILNTEQKRLVYHLSDGKTGSVSVAKATNVSDSTVRLYWASWARLGIMEPIRVRGGIRYEKSFELTDFGFSIPEEESN